MKLRAILAVTLIACGASVSAFASLSAKDRQLLQRHAVQDAELASRHARAEKSVSPAAIDLGFLSDQARQDGCVDSCVATCQGGTGSALCWDRCVTEGYNSQTCAPRCGITTPAGSQACWGKCTAEGYNSGSCAPRCGTATGAGSGFCWDRCLAEGYSSSTCAPRCGIATAEGTRACWDRCSSEGYSSDTCRTRCGNH